MYPQPAPQGFGRDPVEFTGHECFRCGEATAMVCNECTRAAAIGYWSAISRHAGTDVSCVFCAGDACFCAMCWPDQVMLRRAELNAVRAHWGYGAQTRLPLDQPTDG